MKKLSIILLISVSSNAVYAQFNDSTYYHANYVSSGSINKTQDGSSYLLSNALNFGVRKDSVSFNLNSSFAYGKQNDALTNRDFLTTITANVYKFAPLKHTFYWGLVNYNTSYSLKLNSQAQIGAGIAYSIIDKTNTYISLSDGIIYDQSDLMTDTVRDIYDTYRNSFRLLVHISVKDVVVFDASGFLQNSLQQGSDYIIKSNSTLTIKLKKWLGFTTSLAYNRLNSTDSENLLLTYGLTFDKYF